MADDKLEIEITADGRVKVTTDQVSPANHRSADALIEFIARMTGGETIKQKRPQAHTHHAQKVRQG